MKHPLKVGLTSGIIAMVGDTGQTDYLICRETFRAQEASVFTCGMRRLMQTADDPRVSGAAPRIKYEFWSDSYVYGGIQTEVDPVTNVVLAKFEGVGVGNYTNSGPKVTCASGQAPLRPCGM